MNPANQNSYPVDKKTYRFYKKTLSGVSPGYPTGEKPNPGWVAGLSGSNQAALILS
jgi:hypothetical protein